jgi:hypothetical protein
MTSRRTEIWTVGEMYLNRFVAEHLEASSLQERADLLRKWLDPRRGVIRRLTNKPILADARPSAQLIFVKVLGDKILEAAKQCR